MEKEYIGVGIRFDEKTMEAVRKRCKEQFGTSSKTVPVYVRMLVLRDLEAHGLLEEA